MRRWLYAALTLGVGCSSLGDDHGADAGSAASLDQVVEVFGTACAGTICHVGFRDVPAGELDLSAGRACESLIGVPAVEAPDRVRVVPGDAAASYLICKLVDCPDLPAGASTMPLGADALSPEAIALLTDWVDAGAPGCSAADTAPPAFAGAELAEALPSAIRVSWQPASDDVTAAGDLVYLVYEADQAGGQDFASPTITTAPGATSVVVGSLPVSTTRYYVVRARDRAGNVDDNTVEVSATTPETGDETAPSFAGVTTAAASGSTSVLLGWTPATDDITPAEEIRYRAYVATTPGGHDFASPMTVTVPGDVDLLVTGLTPDTEYFFVVRAVDAAGNEDTNTVEAAATTGGPVSFADDVQPILTANCTELGCHGFPMPAEGLDLRAGMARAHLVGVPSAQCSNRLRVDPGSPDTSYLVHKIANTDLCFGSPMPKVGSLSAAEIAIIRDWVDQGALDN